MTSVTNLSPSPHTPHPHSVVGLKEVLKTKQNNLSYNPIIDSRKNSLNKKLKDVTTIVDYLAMKLGGGDAYLPLYRKAAWNLPDDRIRQLLALAVEKSRTNPRGYFVACVKREKGYYGH